MTAPDSKAPKHRPKADPLAAAKAWIETMSASGVIGHFRPKEAQDALVALLVEFSKGARGADAFEMGARWALVEAESKIARIVAPTSRDWGVDK